MSYDNACKYLAEQYPAEFVRWLLGVEPSNITVLKTELSIEPIRVDTVVFLQVLGLILHLEFQTLPTSNPPIPLRMLDYSVRLKRKHRCDVEQAVIFLQETTSPEAFTEVYQDRTTLHSYRVIRLWEQPSALFLANPALLPLATLTATTSPQTLLSLVAEEIATISDSKQRQEVAGCAEILAGLRFEKDVIRQFFREEIMRESVIYQDILQKGFQQGKHEGEQTLIIRLLNRRLGEIDSTLLSRIQGLSIEQVEALGEALLDFSQVADLVAWFQQHSS